MELKNKTKEDIERANKLKLHEDSLLYFAKEYHKKGNSQDKKIECYKAIKQIIDSMFFFPEMHNSKGIFILNEGETYEEGDEFDEIIENNEENN